MNDIDIANMFGNTYRSYRDEREFFRQNSYDISRDFGRANSNAFDQYYSSSLTYTPVPPPPVATECVGCGARGTGSRCDYCKGPL